MLVDGSAASGAASLASAKASTTSVVSDPRVFMEEIVVTGVKEGVTTRLTAPFEAVYVCVNGGGQVPSATNKTTFVGNLEASALFPAAKNGKATGSLLTGPLPSSAAAAAATGFTLPVGAVARVRPGHLLQHGALGGRRRDHSAAPRSSCPNRYTA